MSALSHASARDLLHALIDGELLPSEQAELEAHLAECKSCELDLTELKAASAAMRRLRPAVDDAAVLQVRQAVRAARAGAPPVASAWPFNLGEVFPQVGMAAMAGMLMLLLGTVLLQSARKREAARSKFVMARIEEQPAFAPAAPASEPASAPAAAPPAAPARSVADRSRADQPAPAGTRAPVDEPAASGEGPAPAMAPVPASVTPPPPADAGRDALTPPPYAPEPRAGQAAKSAEEEAPRVAENAAPPALSRLGRAAPAPTPVPATAAPPVPPAPAATQATRVREEDAHVALADARYTVTPRARFADPSSAPHRGAAGRPSADAAGAGAAPHAGPCADARIPEFPAYPNLHAGDRERLPLTVRVAIDGAGRIIRIRPEAGPNQMPLASELRGWLSAQRVHPVVCNGSGVTAEILLEYEWPE